MKKIYDISLTITPGMTVWPGDPSVKLERINKIEDGANANVSHIEMSVHTGTHLDSPYHFLPNGKSVETLPLDVLIGAVQVIELPDSCNVINSGVLKTAGMQTHVERVLFKTRNSHYWEKGLTEFQTDFVGINEDGAQFLVDRGIQLVGIDYLSISPYKHSRPTHEILLKSNVVILEGVNLSGVPAGDYDLICMPLKLGGSDGAPARVVLIAE
ncbi:MAG TPA: cyclase family protein [Anaerolineaceae bacterium]|nr:cyclase family protein [Anaerolineaceae bacterium]